MTHVDLSRASAAAGGSLSLGGYLATPEGAGPFPGVVLIHEAFGLNDQMRRHADRLALAGYLTLAVDLFSDGGPRRCLVGTLKGAAARLETALDSLGVEHDVKEFPSAGHSFLNEEEVGPRTLRPLMRVLGIGPDPESAPEAWRRIEEHFAKYLKT